MSVHHLFEHAAALHPENIAVAAGDESFTYTQLNGKSNQLAHRLAALGVGRDVCVGICLDRSVQMLVGLLGVLKAGGAYVPLDPAFPRERLKYMLDNSGAKIIVTQSKLLSGLPQNDAQIVCLDANAHAIDGYSSDNPPPLTAPSDLAYVIYTSGSTGQPKGVEVTHGGVVNYLNGVNRSLNVTRHDVFMAVTTLSFDICAFDLYSPLVVGGKVILVDRETASNGMRLRDTLQRSDATTLQATPATWRMLIEAGWNGSAANGTPIRALSGGEALPRSLADALLTRGADLWNLYGPTETTIYSTIHRVTPGEGAVPIGKALDHQSVYVLDEKRQPTPPGEIGEIYIGGLGVARGYRNRPDLTAERFVRDPFAPTPDARMYRTGDIGRFAPDGALEYLGRADHQVKIRGYRIELGEIEGNLLDHPGVRAAVVVAQERDNGAQRLVAFVAGDSANLSAQALRDGLKDTLPNYMIPAQFVVLPSLPLTFNGKIDRKALPLPPWGKASQSDQAAPTDAVHAQLMEIFRKVLGVGAVGENDSFFDLGGDSLSAVSLAIHIERRFHRTITLAELFESPTIAEIAPRLVGHAQEPESTFMKLRAGGNRPPLFCLPGSGGSSLSFERLVQLLPADRPVYGYNIPPLDQRPAPLATVHDYAIDVLAQIRRVCPTGPFHLLGYSFGGTVAFEIAHILAQRGQTLGSLGIIDSWAPGYPRKLPLIPRLLLHLHNIVAGPSGTRLSYLSQRIANLFERVFRRYRRLRRAMGNSWPFPASASRTMIDILEVAELSLCDYELKPLDRRVDFYRVDVPPPNWPGNDFSDPFNGWRGYVKGELHVARIPCNHDDVFKEDGIVPLAAAVAGQLKKAEEPPRCASNAIRP